MRELGEKEEIKKEVRAMTELDGFFVVTQTSIYFVRPRGEDGLPYADKIAIKEESRLPVGHRINNGTMFAIARHLQCYVPEGKSLFSPQSSFERRLEQVSSRWWGAGTSPITALFFSERAARECLGQPELEASDSRWTKETREVIAAIGDDHPTIYICRHPGLALAAALVFPASL